jgi:hypothetical protein
MRGTAAPPAAPPTAVLLDWEAHAGARSPSPARRIKTPLAPVNAAFVAKYTQRPSVTTLLGSVDGSSRMNGRALLLHGLGAAALLLGACAQAPETVAAAPVSGAQYHGWSCPRLRGELGRLDRTLAALFAEQRQSRNDDALGAIFLLAPAASMSGGDLRRQIAHRKGEQMAVRSTLSRRCLDAVRF